MLNALRRIYQHSTIEPQPLKWEEGFLSTPFGLVKMVKNHFLTPQQITQVTKAYYLQDGISANFIKRIFKSDTNYLILFDCNKAHFINAFELFQATKKDLNEQYYGTPRKPKNPFEKCKSPREIFHLHRHIQTNQKKLLSRICLQVTTNGDLRIQGQSRDSISLQYYLDDDANISNLRYKSNDYLIPFNSYLGILSSLGYEKDGVAIEQLQNQKVYALFGVWPPTQKQYLSLFHNYAQKLAKLHQLQKARVLNTLEIGCGTGVLGFIMARALKGPNYWHYAIDNIENAVKSAKINAQNLAIENYRSEVMDILDLEKIDFKLKEYKFPRNYELIYANPPWIQASKLRESDPLENTTLDPNGEMLKSIFEFAAKHLQQESHDTVKGRLVLIYSDLSQKLDLQEKDQVQKLCKHHEMIVTQYQELPFQSKEVSNDVDPLRQYKQDCKVQLFEIQKI